MSIRERRARYEARNPEWTREQRRKKARRQWEAAKLMRERFPQEYRSLLDPSIAPGTPRSRAAVKALKARHPDAWRACLEQARKEQAHGSR